MSSTTFQDFQTPILASWLNDVNGVAYSKKFPDATHAQTAEALSAPTGSSLVGHLPSGSGALATTVAAQLQFIQSVTLNVKDAPYYAKGDGVTNDTAAINAALAYAKSLPYGAEVFLPPGAFAVTELDMTALSGTFSSTVKLRGCGRWITRIVPFAAGNVLLNLLGRDDALVEDLQIDSSAYISQAAIFLARSTTSASCNNNKFRNVWITGGYSVASITSNGSESSTWRGGRVENSNASASYRCLWAGGQTGVKALQGISTVNGGTVLDTANPATDNKMFGVEFYAPYSSAAPLRFTYSADYAMVGCTVICGSSNNCKLVTYDAYGAGSNTFVGPITWNVCHMEVYGTGNTVHWLNGNGSAVSYFNGINNYGGYYNTYSGGNTAAVIDYDRTNILEQPVLRGSVWTSPSVAPGASGTNAYLYGLFASSFTFKPNENDGNLFLSGYAQKSTIDVSSYLGGGTRFVGCYHTTVASAIPTSGTYTVGETIQRETPVVGQPVGWKCITSGTLGTLNGNATTGSISAGSNVLTLSTATGVSEGQRIDVGGSGAGPYYIRKLSGVTAYLDSNSVNTVSGAAVVFSNGVLTALANL